MDVNTEVFYSILPVLKNTLLILKSWWWFFLLLILYFPIKALYLWWVRWEVWYPKQKWIFLEIKPPKEILKPLTAMEDVFSVLWGIYDRPNWREIWCEGQLPPGSFWMSCEIVSIGGKISFLIRCLQEHRDMLESAIYAHYPDVEISLTEDYTKHIPQDIPNKEWDIYGEDYFLLKDDIYPIKTYPKFFEPAGEKITQEEKRIDPLNSFLEALTKLRPDEQFWFQLVINPIINLDVPWETRGKEIIDKLAGRRGKVRPKSMVQEAIDVLITGKSTTEPSVEKEIIPPEMKLTPGERDIIIAIGNKISKRGFKIWMRGVYVAKRDAWNPTNRILARAYMNHFSTSDLNTILYWIKTRTRIHYWFRSRRLFVRKRNMFRNCVNRFPPRYPRASGKGVFILNTEELATIFHLPSKVIVPTLPYVEAKKAGPPPELPTE